MENHHATGQSSRLMGWVFFAVSLLIISVAGFAVYSTWFKPKPPAIIPSKSIPAAPSQKMSFPLYYPSPLPAGFSLKTPSFVTSNEVATISYTFDSSKQLVITQQALPINIEQVTKTKEFMTSIGPAYIADLNGRPTGFVLASKTLIILNSSEKIKAEQLQQVMSSFVQLK